MIMAKLYAHQRVRTAAEHKRLVLVAVHMVTVKQQTSSTLDWESFRKLQVAWTA